MDTGRGYWAIELARDIEEASGWLERALDVATEDDDAVNNWPALKETAEKIGKVLEQARLLQDLHPEIEAARQEQWEEICSHDSADNT